MATDSTRRRPTMAKGTLVHKPKNPPYRTTRCRAVAGLTKWCYGLCEPDNGYGLCGRVAPHAVKGRTQKAIAKYLAEKAELEAAEDEDEPADQGCTDPLA